MAKKNENTQKKVSKWDVAPKSIKDLYFAIGGVFDGLSSIIGPEMAGNEENALIKLLAKVLDDYNELEAKHQKDTGMISEYDEENRNLKNELDIKTDVCNALENDIGIYRSNWINANEKLNQLLTLLAAVDVTARYEGNDNDGIGNWTVCNTLKMKNLELEVERQGYETELHCILENIEAALGIQRIHLVSSYGDRADYIIKKIKHDRSKYFVYESVATSHYGLHSKNHDGPETLESLKKFLMDEYKFDAEFIHTDPDDGYWTLIQRGPNVFNRKSNNFRWAFQGAMRCLGMSSSAIVAETRWTGNTTVTPGDIAAKWDKRACEKFETKE